ncbi:MAG: hypothetical protein ACR2MY_10285 [Candidatus Dormibacteria bacterium]
MTLRRALAALALLSGLLVPTAALAAPSPSPIPCLKTLKFGGALYLDADTAVPSIEAGPTAGITDPNPAYCGLSGGGTVYLHRGHPPADEVLYYTVAGQAELFKSAGSTGLPMQATVRWLVLALVVGILGFAALPAILAHVRQPPLGVGSKGDDIYDPPKIDMNGH